MKIEYERLISRSVVSLLESELKLAGVKMGIDHFLRIVVTGSIAMFVIIPFILVFGFKIEVAISALAGFVAAGLFAIVVYALLEFQIEQRKNFVETILPDYLQLAGANVRSGIAIDKAMVLAARPEFGEFSEDVREINKELYGGVTLQGALVNLGKRYRSLQLQHTVRMMNEGIQYGGGMTDLLNQISKDMRNQQMVQKEISGQLFMYTLFIAFAGLIATPLLFALTSQMIGVTTHVWQGILKQYPGGLPSTGFTLLKPTPPQITQAGYQTFAYASIIIITGFVAFIVSAISSGSVLKGLRYLPVFVGFGLILFFASSSFLGGIFSTISGGAGGSP